MKQLWNVKESMKNMRLFDRELKRLHKLLATEIDYDLTKGEVIEEINKIHRHMLTVSRRIAGLDY